MNVEVIVGTVQAGFWFTVGACVVAAMVWPMPREKGKRRAPARWVR